MSERFYIPGQTGDIPGIESVIEIDELVMGDRRFPDRIQLNKIDGLFGADVRDAREANPQAHGETPFNAFYGGRTLTFDGVIKTGNFNRLRNMATLMERATGDFPAEKNVYLRTNGAGWQDDFMTNNWYEYAFIGSSKLLWAPGQLTVPALDSVQRGYVKTTRGTTHEYQEVIVEFVTGSTGTVTIDAIPKYLANGDFICGSLVTSNTLKVRKNVGGSYTDLATLSVSGVALNKRYWLRAVVYDAADIIGSTGWLLVTSLTAFDPSFLTQAQLWGRAGYDILDGGSAVPAAKTYNFDSTQNSLFGVGKFGYGGFTFYSTDASHFVRSVKVLPMENNDKVVKARKTSAISMSESQSDQGPAVQRPFLLTMRASDPRIKSQIQRSRYMAGITTSIPFQNKGNAETEPIITFVGPQLLPRIANLLAGTTLALDASILTGDYYEVDVANRTVKDKLGNSKMSTWKAGSDWLTLLPGTQVLSWSKTNASNANTATSVAYQDTWI